MKKILSVLLALTMCATILSACGDNKDSEETTSKDAQATKSSEDTDVDEIVVKDATISMLYCDNANFPYRSDWLVFDKIREETGITLDMTVVASSDFESKLQTALADIEGVPDIIAHYTPTAQDALSGAILPISDYEDQMPHYKEFIEKNGLRDMVDKTRMSDGKYYTIPTQIHSTTLCIQDWLIRTDLFEKNDIKVPTNLDELYEAGLKLKELYPDSTPITNRFGTGNILTAFAGGFGTIAGWTLGDGIDYIEDTNSWEFAPTTEKYKDMCKYIKKLLDAGILDSEWGTLDSTVYEQRITESKTFMMFDWAANITRYNALGKEINPDYNVSPIYPPKGQNDNYMVKETKAWDIGSAIPMSAKDRPEFEDILRFIDWCYTDEACILLTFGVEGETYKIDENGTYRFIDPENINYYGEYGLDNNSFEFRQHEDVFYSAFTPEEKQTLQKIAADGIIPQTNPASPLSADQTEALSIKTNGLLDYVGTQTMNFVNGTRSFDEWDDFVKECEDMGSAELVKAYNDAWAARG